VLVTHKHTLQEVAAAVTLRLGLCVVQDVGVWVVGLVGGLGRQLPTVLCNKLADGCQRLLNTGWCAHQRTHVVCRR
jgi:hypothetical protein